MAATLKTTIIQEPSSASTNIQLDASGNTYLVPVSGLVGIGTTAPNRLLTLSGSGTSTRVQLNNTVSGKNFGLYAADTGDSTINYGTSAALLFTQSGTETMRIDSSGNLLVGTTSAGAGAIVDVQSTIKGVRFPNMTTTQKNAITPAAGTVVFDTTLAKLCVYSGSAWQTITSV
jgi:hypothetical protein